MRANVVITGALALVCAACVLETGGGGREVDAFMSGRGANVRFQYQRESRVGELLGFRNDTAFVLANRALHAVPRRALLDRSEVATFSTREGARRARYGLGITAELEAQLLSKLGQAATLR